MKMNDDVDVDVDDQTLLDSSSPSALSLSLSLSLSQRVLWSCLHRMKEGRKEGVCWCCLNGEETN